jgi:hypothetical protein
MSDEEHIKILKQRYAKGEISKKEYNQMREDLEIARKPSTPKQQINEFVVNKNKMLIVGGVIVILVMAYLVYSWMAGTPSSIQVISAPYSVFGNNTAVSIPVVVYSPVGRMNSGEVNVQTNVGSAQPCLVVNGNCNITFTPGVQTKPVTADIELSDGSAFQQITISVRALTSLSVNSGSTQLYNNNVESASLPAGVFANPSSPVNLTVEAYDNNNKPISGQRINFSIDAWMNASNDGSSLSNNYCITKEGSCSIEFNPSTSPGSLSIVISAGNINLDVPVAIVSPSYNVTFTPSANSVQSGGNVTLSGKVRYSSNYQPAYDVGILFVTVDTTSICTQGGGLCFTEGQNVNFIGNCNANRQGECNITYAVPGNSGNVDIAAAVYPWPGYNGKYPGMRFGTDNDDNGDCGNINCPSYVLNSGGNDISYPTYTEYDTISIT